jgi:NADH-quinone oxidoreductase subunit H
MDWNFLFFALVKIVCVIVPVLTMVAYAVLAERKISAWIQDRVGPNRTAPPLALKIPVVGRLLQRWGIFQPLADGLKFLLKENFTPSHVRKTYF